MKQCYGSLLLVLCWKSCCFEFAWNIHYHDMSTKCAKVCVKVRGKPTVQPILGNDVLDSSCKTNSTQCISFMSIWWYQEEQDDAGF